MRRPQSRRRSPVRLATAATLLALAVFPVLGLAAAARAQEFPRDAAFRSFQRFAREWVGSLQGDLRRYRGLRFEVRPTGDRTVPYVGVLRYDEELLACPPGSVQDCTVVRRSPITELFPFERGRWRY